MHHLTRSLVLVALSGASVTALAQAPAAPAPAAGKPAPVAGNLVINGQFTKFTTEDNLWDGVNGSGSLAGWNANIYAATEAGRAGGVPMPISVNFVDVNGDKLPDIVTADPTGYMRAYINSGTQTEPKFTHAEMVPLFLPRVARDTTHERGLWMGPFGAPKISLFDWNKRGTLDLVVGNFIGDILLLPNSGSAQAPMFAQPASYGKVKVETSAKRPWGNLFAPVSVDWNKDGKTDLLVGEGSYSANAVYVLLNQSSSNTPKFVEEQRYYLCYGDGREQLVPTVADYNGDGLPDVLVGDRLGRVGVYLNQGSWKPGTELPRATDIKFGASDKAGATAANTWAVAPHAADYNGDGLFDLLIGRADGRVSVAINKGTKTEPKFDTPVEIKGTDLFTEKLNIPSNFTWDAGKNRGNLYGYLSVQANSASPGGGKVLKAGYFESPNKVFKLVTVGVDGRDTQTFFHYDRNEWETRPASWDAWSRSSDCFVLRQQIASLKVGGTYSVTFKAKGAGIVDGSCTVAYLGAAETTGKKYVRSDRGVKIDRGDVHEEVRVQVPFTASGAWKDYEKTFTVAFTKEKEVKGLEATTLALIDFTFTLPQYSADCEIADVQIVAKPAK